MADRPNDPIRELEEFIADLHAKSETGTLGLLKMLRHLTGALAEVLGGTVTVIDALDKPANHEDAINEIVASAREILLVWKGVEASLDPTIEAHEPSSD